MPTLVSAGSVRTQRDITACELPFEAVDIVELDDAGRHGRIDRRPEIAAPRTNDSVVAERREGLVDGAVVAPVEDEDDWTAQSDGGRGGSRSDLRRWR